MKRIIIPSIFLLVYSLGVKSLPLNVSTIKQLNDLPSASAMTYADNILYAVGDDSPYLYSLDLNFNILNKVRIHHGQVNNNGRVPSPQKADLEGASLFTIDGNPTLVMVGSGTYTDTREKALLYSLKDNTLQWKNVKPLYRHLRAFAQLNKQQFINIEGLASNKSLVFLLSRGTHAPNMIFTFKKDNFIRYISGQDQELTPISVQKVTLASINHSEATLSGATWHSPTQTLIVTASVDDDNSGGIKGSFVARIDIKELATDLPIDLSKRSYRIQHNGSPLMSKVETVVVTHSNQEHVSGVLAADNDDGTSQFMTFNLSLAVGK